MSPENEQVFKHCDSFVVLSSDEQKKHEWLEFGQRLGLECIGCLDSSLEGQEKIYERTPYFQGKIVGLERGEILQNSQVIQAIVSDIIRKSKYAEKKTQENNIYEGIMIDDTELGFELGFGKEIFTEDGTMIKKVRWLEEAIPKVYQTITDRVSSEQPIKINGIRANFILSSICKACKKSGARDISVYDIRLRQYVPIRDLPKKIGIKETDGLAFHTIENQNSIFMDIDITKEQYSLEDYKNCILPQIKQGKDLYLSGRMPLWLLASISISYDSDRIFTFQPGKGFTCVSSIDENDLGCIVNGIDGINLKKYFEDKRKMLNKPKYLTVIEKQGLLSRLKELFSFIKNRLNSKYLDDKITATRTNPITQYIFSDKNKFQQDLQQRFKDLSMQQNDSVDLQSKEKLGFSKTE